MLGPPHLRFYAGAPLVDSTGCRLGSLCVLDHKPREFDAENCNVLCNFAEVVVREMEKDKRRVSLGFGEQGTGAGLGVAVLVSGEEHGSDVGRQAEAIAAKLAGSWLSAGCSPVLQNQ